MTALRIGLTGGIGCGKSSVSRRFEALGVPVFDADQISRELVEPGQPALTEIITAFGPSLLTPEGRLDRSALRQHIFANRPAREQLQSILHPRIRATLQQRASACVAPYCLLAIPLLLESGLTTSVDRILVVDCDEQAQIARASQRDGSPPEQIRAIMATQVSRPQRLAAADEIVHNDGDEHELDAQVIRLHQHYLHLSHTLQETTMHPHLTHDQLTALKQQLNQQRSGLLSEIQAELRRSDNSHYADLADQVHDRGDESVADLMADIDHAVVHQHITQLRALEAALLAIAEGHYGLCRECGAEIGFARLNAVATAPRCLACQARYEHDHPQSQPSL